MVRAEPHLIPPVDLGPGLLGRLADGRVLLRQPPADRHGILLEGPPPGFLRREAPAFQVAADGPDRDVQAERSARSRWTASRVQRAKGRRS